MSKLRLLIIDGQHIPNALNHVPKDLRYLPWSFCSLKCLPSSFQPKKLVQLDLRCSKFEYLWEEVMHSVKLKFIDLVVPKTFLGNLTIQVFRDLRD
nr:disease resistance protein rps6 [Quercus suber]